MTNEPVEARAASPLRILWWGLTLRCPRCGAGHLFRRYFHLVDDCPRCGLHFEREAGYFAGALAVNIICVGGLFAIVFITLLAATIPEIPVVSILVVVVPIVIVGPIVWYPFSKTLWMAVDRAFLQRLDSHERLDERGSHH